MGEASLDQFCHCQGCLGKYTLLRDEENPRLAMFERRLPCFGCGIGWSSFLLGFLCPLIWYYAATLYCCKYYNREPRERPGLAASAVAVVIFTIVTRSDFCHADNLCIEVISEAGKTGLEDP